MKRLASSTHFAPLPQGWDQLLPVVELLRNIHVAHGGAHTTTPPGLAFQTLVFLNHLIDGFDHWFCPYMFAG